MKCNNCGYVNPDENDYCAKCGKKFTRIQSELTDMNPEIPPVNTNSNTQRPRYKKQTTTDKIRNIPTSYKLLACIAIIILIVLVGFATPGNNDTIPLLNNSDNNPNNNAYNDTDNNTKPIETILTLTTNNNIKAGENANINGTLYDETNKTLIDCVISVNIDGNEYQTKTDTDGKYSYEYNDATAGDHKITVLYAGDENIEASQNSTTLNVEYIKSNITLEIENKLTTEDKIVAKGKLVNEDNTPIANAQVKIITEKTEQSVTTQSDGSYSLDITDIELKTQNITAKYEGDHNTEGCQATTQVEIDKLKTKLEAGINDVKDNLISITGLLTDEDNNPITNAPITIETDNQDNTTSTDENGQISTDINDDNTTKVELEYEGNDTTDSSQITLPVEKEKIKTSIDVKTNDTPEIGQSITVTGTLKDEDNHPLEDATIKLTLDGKEHTLKTDSNGQYETTLNITSSSTEISVVYEGNNIYEQCHDTLKLKIEDNNTTLNNTTR